MTAGLAGSTTLTALNPYNPAASNPAVLAAIRDFTNYGQADQTLDELRTVLDGTLFETPAGDVKVAFGAEYHEESITIDSVQRTARLDSDGASGGCLAPGVVTFC